MGITHAMWVHGTSMKIEYPNRIKSTWRAGFYTRVVGKKNTSNWFHFHIPTVVIDDDKRQMIDSVMLRYRSRSSQARITSAHIYDGERIITSYDNLTLSDRNFTFRRFNVPGKPSVLWGIGLSLGIRFTGTTDAQNTMEFSSAGVDLNLFETVRLHFKVLTAPTTFTIDEMLQGMRDVFEPTGIRVIRASDENLNLPTLNTVNVGSCAGSITSEQDTLFDNRNNVGTDDIAVYMVLATNPALNGCASSPSDRPSVVVASTASRWTLGHEIGHVLGLGHVDNNDRLMTGNGTNNITNPPPNLTSSEINTMKNNSLSVNA